MYSFFTVLLGLIKQRPWLYFINAALLCFLSGIYVVILIFKQE